MGGEIFSPFTAGSIPDGADRALANRLVTTALRRSGHLDLVIKALLERGLPKKSGSFEAALRIGLAQLLFLPDLGEHSALFLAVEQLKRDPKAAHVAKLANAVLRRAQAEAERFRSLPRLALIPETLGPKWLAAYGEPALVGFVEALLAGAPLDLTLKDADPELIAALGGELVAADTVRVADRDRSVEALPGFAEGQWWVQDAAAAIPARLIGLPVGARVLDLCAAPGGKTAQLLKAGYRVTALDSDADRLARLRVNLARLGMTAEIVHADAETYQPTELFDAVLLDAPCSATGTFRRHPEVLINRGAATVGGRIALQRRLLKQAAADLTPGGVLIYCVCSLEPEEGERQARWAAATDLGLERDVIADDEAGVYAGSIDADGAIRTHPASKLPVTGGMDGFYVARFRKRAEVVNE
ncbi:MAG: transporter [Devosia sp.]|nr:transporter [Devosia sp.]